MTSDELIAAQRLVRRLPSAIGGVGDPQPGTLSRAPA
jgi:hypothetical protein